MLTVRSAYYVSAYHVHATVLPIISGIQVL